MTTNIKKSLLISGVVQKIIYKNENNGYTVLWLETQDELLTAVGSMPGVTIGETLSLTGAWQKHSTFGEQFGVQTFTRISPSGKIQILKYLSAGAIKGIGPVLAEKLVDEFGDKTLEIIENEPEKLAKIKGITKDKAKKMSADYSRIFGMRKVIASLSAYKISPAAVIRAFSKWGGETVDVVMQNPYSLCDESIGVDFSIADQIFMSSSRPANHAIRLRAGIIHLISHNMKNAGHTCLPESKIIEACTQFMHVNSSETEQSLKELKSDGSLVSEIIDGVEFVFLPDIYRCEIYVAQRLKMMLKFPAQSIVGVSCLIGDIERETGIKYAHMQKNAIEEALGKGLLILTGGPGTGKTTTLKAIIKILNQKGEKVQLAAPTGRAAQRMSELTGEEAKTVHRLLEADWELDGKQTFRRNGQNLLKCDTLILDEVSMIDLSLFESILQALPLGCRLIMVGDSDQLPSVGAGSILSEMIRCGKIPVIALNQIFRQSMQSLIVTNAHKIVGGLHPELEDRNSDFFFLKIPDSAKIASTIEDLCCRRLPRTYGYSPLFDMQILCTSKKGPLGTFELNKNMQQALNPPSEQKKEITIGAFTLREGDKVMQTRNNYNIEFIRKKDCSRSRGIFNGDVGILTKIDKYSGQLTVQFDDKQACYETADIIDLELAYAITIHKSQGSEFRAVIMPVFGGPPQLIFRNLLYTGVTRAKSLIILLGLKSTISKMVQNDNKTKRYSGLSHFIT